MGVSILEVMMEILVLHQLFLWSLASTFTFFCLLDFRKHEPGFPDSPLAQTFYTCDFE
jgi:hypothetical protein